MRVLCSKIVLKLKINKYHSCLVRVNLLFTSCWYLVRCLFACIEIFVYCTCILLALLEIH